MPERIQGFWIDTGQPPLSSQVILWRGPPRLCYSKDAVVYQDARKLARNIEMACSAEVRGKFVLLWSDCESVSIPLCFAERRARRSFAPQAVVLCHCDVLPWDTLGGWHRIWFSETASRMFEFTSVWTLAKSILAAGVPTVNFTIGRREWRQDPETQGNSFSSSILVVKWSGDVQAEEGSSSASAFSASSERSSVANQEACRPVCGWMCRRQAQGQEASRCSEAERRWSGGTLPPG